MNSHLGFPDRDRLVGLMQHTGVGIGPQGLESGRGAAYALCRPGLGEWRSNQEGIHLPSADRRSRAGLDYD